MQFGLMDLDDFLYEVVRGGQVLGLHAIGDFVGEIGMCVDS